MSTEKENTPNTGETTAKKLTKGFKAYLSARKRYAKNPTEKNLYKLERAVYQYEKSFS